MKRLALLLCLLLFVPVIGWAVATAIQANIDSQLIAKGHPGSHVVCSNPRIRAELRSFCEQVDAIELMRDLSIYVGFAGLILPLSFWIVSVLIGSSRLGCAFIFPVLVRLSLLSLAGIVLIQGGIFVYAVFIGESYFAGRVHGVLLAIVGLGALFVCIALVKHAFTLGGKREMHVAGMLLDRATHSETHRLVDHVADRLGARSPDNIVVGLDPTFFATSANIRLQSRAAPLTGETLFISLPLSRVLAIEEIIAILGHELGHFRGKDTAYSLRFAPVYVGLGSAFESVAPGEERDSAFQLMALPAAALLDFMFDVFSRNESKIRRTRELAADRAATEVASADALGTALMKVATFAPLWPYCQRENINRLKQGLLTKNLSLAFADLIRYDLDKERVSARMGDMLQTRISHPTDSHPPIAERLTALCGQVPHYTADSLLAVADGTTSLDDFDTIEKELTVLEHRTIVSAGIGSLPDEKAITEDQKFRQLAMNAAYVLGATIINADGRWTPAQFAAAQEAQQGLMPDFDRVDFREYCRYPHDAPDANTAIEFFAETLSRESRNLISQWLRRITFAERTPSQQALDWFTYIEHRLSQEDRRSN